jgi:hypothetical protein
MERLGELGWFYAKNAVSLLRNFHNLAALWFTLSQASDSRLFDFYYQSCDDDLFLRSFPVVGEFPGMYRTLR